MKVGDILTGKELERPPFYNIVIRQEDGFSWDSNDAVGHLCHDQIHINDWKLVHLTGPIVPRVGDLVETEEQAKALPVGSVIVAVDSWDHGSDPAIKIGVGRWLYSDGSGNEGVVEGDDMVLAPHRVVYIPGERANSGAGR